MIGYWLDVRRPGGGRAIDQRVGVVGEDLDPRRRHPDIVRARLAGSSGYGLVHEERRPGEAQPRHAAEVPQHVRAEREPYHCTASFPSETISITDNDVLPSTGPASSHDDAGVTVS